MTVLPIARRELRIAARKSSTFWVRLVGAMVALIIGAAFLLLASHGTFGFAPGGLGRPLFAALTWLCLGVALATGLFLTSDTLSEEKRDGTLGLLFLTDLKGYDIVSGKLLSSSLRGLYALLAAFPVLAITLLFGGVSGPQFWKTCLALLNALFVSLSAGMFISSISRDSQRSLAGTLALLLVLVAAGPLVDGIIAEVQNVPFTAYLSISSPGYCFVAASAWVQTPYWWALLLTHAVAWSLLGASCLLVPGTWQERPKASSDSRHRLQRQRFGNPETRATRRNRLLAINPVLWLAARERWQIVLLWSVTLLLLALVVLALVAGDRMAWIAFSYLGGACTLIFYIALASQSGRLFIQARRNGLFELMLVTPLTVQQIIQGQWRALLRMFAPPLVLWLLVVGTGSYLQQRAWSTVMTTTTATVTSTNAAGIVTTNVMTVTNSPGGRAGGPGASAADQWVPLLVSILKSITVAANFIALVWFGMWMGLNSKNTNLATLKNFVFVQIIPWFVINFLAMLLVPLFLLPLMGGGATGFMNFWPLLFATFSSLLCLAKDVGFISWSRSKLYAQFRQRAAGMAGPRQIPMASAASAIAPASAVHSAP